MPSRTLISSHALRAIKAEPYVCPSCLLKGSVTNERPQTTILKASQHQTTRSYIISKTERPPYRTQLQLPRSRSYATNDSLASTTAINAPSTVPPELRELHQRLQLLQDKASGYVDLSRLQLALRSLESADPVVRIAFLGLGGNGVRAARKLARVLLADELGEEEAWEKLLLNESDGRSVLIRYGEDITESGVQPSSTPPVQELRISSPRLRRWNMEILVTGLNATGYTPPGTAESAKELEESILVPPITMPNSSGGRVGFVRYPVHRALIVADGVTGALEYGRLPAALADGRLISAALNLPLQVAKNRAYDESVYGSAVNIELADQALGLFRSSNANGAIYSEKWQESRVASISNWLSAAAATNGFHHGLKPALDEMLSSVLSRAEDAISSAASAAEASSASQTVPDTKRSTLHSAIATWSEEAHRDLQMNLSAALISPTWRRTVWWRLFYRIDEVSISAADVLRRGWLVEAEQNLAFLSGRVLEAGFASVDELKKESPPVPGMGQEGATHDPVTKMLKREIEDYKATKIDGATLSRYGTVAELMQLPPMLAKVEERTGLNAIFDPPWPQTIHLARQQMLHQLVPAMHRKAQTLLLASLSTIGGSGALGGWLFIASGGVALYEAGAIAALGLVWALRRLQKKWDAERATFVETTREDARRVLIDVEKRMRKLVQDGGRVVIREEDRREWNEARAAVKACEDAKPKSVAGRCLEDEVCKRATHREEDRCNTDH
ncbi:hypothetical protein AC579_4946 [Lecanosticta acicola]|uniref:Mmc1 C-terminal domain-containing protein n=1 Tax=Lecanosticta acicola TaxID=111012 RepID=A0AAI9ECE3_9PEZI|nr:hypothetical protein AC579_4946 [Lecanosticta acicola]